jgi:chemotaxis protein CheX
MKVEFINPFVSASFSVLTAVLGSEPTKGKISLRPAHLPSGECSIITGVTGMVSGQVVYGMSMETAYRLASAMIGMPVTEFDQLAASAISELGNMITGNSMSLLAQAGYICDITPPTIIRGKSMRISTVDIHALMIPMITSYGEIEIALSLRGQAGEMNKAA